MPKKAQMNANYRRNERLLEDGEIDVPGSGGGVSQQYVDDADASTLAAAKEYTDDEVAGIEIPEYTAGTGIAINEGVISNTAPNQVPAIAAGDAGKVLQVNAGETGVEWGTASGGSEVVKIHHITSAQEAFNFAKQYLHDTWIKYGVIYSGRLSRGTIEYQEDMFEQDGDKVIINLIIGEYLGQYYQLTNEYIEISDDYTVTTHISYNLRIESTGISLTNTSVAGEINIDVIEFKS